MIGIFISLAIFFIVLCVYLYHIIFKEEPHEKITKTATSIMFFSTAIVSVVLTDNYTSTALFLCAGLFLSIFGDFFLIKKIKIKRSFIIGVGFFFAAQVCYIISFSLLVPISWLDILLFIGIEGSALLIYKLMGFDAKNLKIPLLLYSSVLSFMAVKAVSLVFARPYGIYHGITVAMGALLFLFSDCILAHSILTGGRTLRARLINLVSYYLGQILIAFSIYLIFMNY
ncbi:MAG: YhhN-like protein [Firmicutes bacterium ADurb.Bin146]|nr:MAG: YhhN-like protein [Firmicutes bacterium ADurb.Bin146]